MSPVRLLTQHISVMSILLGDWFNSRAATAVLLAEAETHTPHGHRIGNGSGAKPSIQASCALGTSSHRSLAAEPTEPTLPRDEPLHAAAGAAAAGWCSDARCLLRPLIRVSIFALPCPCEIFI